VDDICRKYIRDGIGYLDSFREMEIRHRLARRVRSVVDSVECRIADCSLVLSGICWEQQALHSASFRWPAVVQLVGRQL
jgi:hypothetical protein